MGSVLMFFIPTEKFLAYTKINWRKCKMTGNIKKGDLVKALATSEIGIVCDDPWKGMAQVIFPDGQKAIYYVEEEQTKVLDARR